MYNLIESNNVKCWEQTISLLSQLKGKPKEFWKKINHLRTGNNLNSQNTYLTVTHECSDSEDSDFGEISQYNITDPADQAEHMGITWARISQPNNGPQFKNNNTKLVSKWFHNHLNSLKHNNILTLDNLIPNHPLLRIN